MYHDIVCMHHGPAQTFYNRSRDLDQGPAGGTQPIALPRPRGLAGHETALDPDTFAINSNFVGFLQ